MPEYQKPIPQPTPETQRYWDGCKRHELWLPYCTDCDQYFFYPRVFCPRCPPATCWPLPTPARMGCGRRRSFFTAIICPPRSLSTEPTSPS